jgi:hypothetical protein
LFRASGLSRQASPHPRDSKNHLSFSVPNQVMQALPSSSRGHGSFTSSPKTHRKAFQPSQRAAAIYTWFHATHHLIGSSRTLLQVANLWPRASQQAIKRLVISQNLRPPALWNLIYPSIVILPKTPYRASKSGTFPDLDKKNAVCMLSKPSGLSHDPEYVTATTDQVWYICFETILGIRSNW